MDDARANRIAGWSGIAFSLLSLIVLPLAYPPPPALGATGGAFATYYREHRVGFLVGNYLGIAAFVPGFVQLAILTSRIRRAEGAHGWFATLVLATGTFTYAVFACSLVVFQVMPFLTDATMHGEAHAMGTLGGVWFALDGLAALPLVTSVAWAGRETKVLPRWFVAFSVAACLLAGAMSAGSLTTDPAALRGAAALAGIGFLTFFVWTSVLSVLFLRGRVGAGGE